jgi:hypothetical protein
VSRKSIPSQTGPTRRQWLAWLKGGATAWLAREALACGDNIDGRANPQDATAIVLEPDHRGFVVAVWSRYPTAALVEVEDTGTGQLVASQPLMIDNTGSAAAQFQSLASDREYAIRVIFQGGLELLPYRARTAPEPDSQARLSLHLAADIDTNPLFETSIFSHMIDMRPDLTLTMGDFPYTDNGPPAITVDDYRRVHAEMRTHSRIAPWLRSTGVRAMYDDHEFRNDWSPRFTEAEPARYQAAIKVWDEFFPLPQAPPEIRYRTWKWGAAVDGFVIDCRRFRNRPDAPAGPTKTMLGQQQKQWLLRSLSESRAPFKLIITSVALDFANTGENWSAFVDEREEIFRTIKDARIAGVLFLSADSHWFASHRHKGGAREFQIGPVARGYHEPPPIVPQVLKRAVTYNFGRIDIDNGTLRFRAIDGNGVELYSETLTPDDLKLS